MERKQYSNTYQVIVDLHDFILNKRQMLLSSLNFLFAGVVELADTQHLKCCEHQLIRVQVPFSVLNTSFRDWQKRTLVTIQ